MKKGRVAKKNVPAEKASQKASSWVQSTDEHQRRTRGSGATASEESSSVGCVNRHVSCSGEVKKERLRKASQFNLVYERGSSVANRFLVLKILPNDLGMTRYGFTVSKRVGKAVKRNRVKRLLRECARLTSIEPGWDIVFIARATASTADFHSLQNATQELLVRAHLLNKTLGEQR